MLLIHAQLSSSAKQVVVIRSIVATLFWYSAMIMCVCHCLQKPSFRHILNAEISQFSQRLGAVPPDPRIWHCLLDQTTTPLLKSLHRGL